MLSHNYYSGSVLLLTVVITYQKMASKEDKMRAVVREGGKIALKSSYAVPTCGSGNVLVRVKAGAINPVDYKVNRLILGKVVGLEFSGVVEAVGANAGKFAVGDEVYGKAPGGLADFAVVNPAEIAIKPKRLSHVEAGAVSLTYLTSLQGLRDFGALKKGDRILVIGASGGTGVAALQLAKSMHAGRVYAVCSGKNAAFVKLHGADEVIDYTQHNLLDYFREGKARGDIDDSLKFDVIYDAASGSGGGEDYKASSLQLLCPGGPNKKHGQYVAINGGVEMWLRKFTIGQKKNQHLFLTNFNTADLDYLSKLIDEGYQGEDGEQHRLAPVIAEQLQLNSENVEKGFELLKSRRAVGKIVFDMTNEK